MGLPVAALAKLKLGLSFSSSHAVVSPFLPSLICPFVIKLACRLGMVRRAYSDIIYASRLFIFQLGRIAFEDSNQDQAFGNRLGRALRLVSQRVIRTRRSPATTQSDEDSFHALSMFSL
ncbi:hypothetical protein MANES_01G080400v8 [Manihot esculenta]|uniref:Uncharacterized protein n=1 Tax=Manihot esculenta TaxID=3983 RepID=A0A2C9WIX9_MANES|nr:hypothetical protein MANES_01G080400v8 [Manihot esculenta]